MQSFISYSQVYEHYRLHRDACSESLRLRIHRALSWLKQGYSENDDEIQEDNLDFRFISLWIAFNAAYANEINERIFAADKSDFRHFLQNVCALDSEKQIYHLLWQTFSGSIRIFLNNRFVFQPFWDFHNGKITEAEWYQRFQIAQKNAHQALSQQDTEKLLLILFDRLYTLRNQLIHGGATFNSYANRRQLADACCILSRFIPIILNIMLNHADQNWGKPFYPFIAES